MPARFRDIKRAAAAHGIECFRPTRGSHWKFKTDKNSYTIPAHNGGKTEITDNYIRGLCRAFDLDFESFKKSI